MKSKNIFWILGGIIIVAFVFLLLRYVMVSKISSEYQGAAVYSAGITKTTDPIEGGMIMCHWWGLDGEFHEGPTTSLGCFFRGGARGIRLN